MLYQKLGSALPDVTVEIMTISTFETHGYIHSESIALTCTLKAAPFNPHESPRPHARQHRLRADVPHAALVSQWANTLKTWGTGQSGLVGGIPFKPNHLRFTGQGRGVLWRRGAKQRHLWHAQSSSDVHQARVVGHQARCATNHGHGLT